MRARSQDCCQYLSALPTPGHCSELLGRLTQSNLQPQRLRWARGKNPSLKNRNWRWKLQEAGLEKLTCKTSDVICPRKRARLFSSASNSSEGKGPFPLSSVAGGAVSAAVGGAGYTAHCCTCSTHCPPPPATLMARLATDLLSPPFPQQAKPSKLQKQNFTSVKSYNLDLQNKSGGKYFKPQKL